MIQVADEFQILIKTAAKRYDPSLVQRTSIDSHPYALFYLHPADESLSLLLSLKQLDTYN